MAAHAFVELGGHDDGAYSLTYLRSCLPLIRRWRKRVPPAKAYSILTTVKQDMVNRFRCAIRQVSPSAKVHLMM